MTAVMVAVGVEKKVGQPKLPVCGHNDASPQRVGIGQVGTSLGSLSHPHFIRDDKAIWKTFVALARLIMLSEAAF